MKCEMRGLALAMRAAPEERASSPGYRTIVSRSERSLDRERMLREKDSCFRVEWKDGCSRCVAMRKRISKIGNKVTSNRKEGEGYEGEPACLTSGSAGMRVGRIDSDSLVDGDCRTSVDMATFSMWV